MFLVDIGLLTIEIDMIRDINNIKVEILIDIKFINMNINLIVENMLGLDDLV